ncbi:beta-glucosidase [Microbacterium sp. Leaf288]|uniref:glycoside hydrolase family 3 C-terminal domain-containing protein n=1 Tax=Microbacterium sp. Leaf288 TaxID=1736323 RepID=UPI0006FE2D6B|nr:glycoside hydrolase family 3 C-terminal domain-containing protein [Microbacterium sp. Leaf288]KQP70046.1 beta-glucosidase [Microbacterium sp. Leaf288]
MNHPQLKNLTLEEKASLLSGGSFWTSAAIERVGIEAATLTDGPHGVRKQDGQADHLGINDSLPSTAFPTAAATGSTWDPELLERLGEALGRESRVLGVDVLLGPGVNIKRSPLCGRNFEYFSEDPILTGKLGAAWVRGIQSQGVGASVKHFAVNNQETDRQRISAEADERTLRELYLRGYEIIVEESRPATFMCSYNRINGVFASENRWLLTTVLRDEWGFDGYVMSDWGAVTDRVPTLEAGLDLEMPTSSGRGTAAIVDAVQRGQLDESVVDVAAARVVDVHERLRADRVEITEVDWDAHHELARELAAASAVLLKNEGDILPLPADDGGPIAVLGEFARSPRYQGAGSSHINPTRLDDALNAIRDRTSRTVLFAPAFAVEEEGPIAGDDEALLAEARDTAAQADVTILFLGLPSIDESEGYDRTHLRLPARQLRVLEAVLKVAPKVVVVLSNGGVVDVSSFDSRVDGILETWLSGQAGGGAVSDILFGDREPGGRLAETIPLRLEDTPTLINWPGANGKVYYGERIYVGYRWYDKTARDVAYPFGHGLGYTSFAYSDLTVDADHTGARVQVTVTNTGSRRGADVVQVYVADPEASVDRPVRELAGFQKVTLESGASQRVVIDLPARAWAFWDDGWRAESGRFGVAVGTSSRDIRLSTEVEIAIPDDIRALDEDSTLNEWMEHPEGRLLLETELANLHPEARNLTGGETLRLAGSIPLRTLVGMAGASDPGTLVNSLLARL